MRISDWSSDVCSSDLQDIRVGVTGTTLRVRFSNELADVPLRIGAASIVRLDAAGKPLAGSLRAMTFSRAADAQVPPLAPMLSSDRRRVGKECVHSCGYRWSLSP